MVCAPRHVTSRKGLVLALTLLLAISLPALPVGADEADDPEPVTSEVDLTITDVVLTPSDPQEGDSATIVVHVTNQGPDDISARFAVTGHSDGRTSFWWTSYVNGLAAGNSTTLATTWHVVEGVHTLQFAADPHGWVDETNETNNAHLFEVTIGDPRPDLDAEFAVLLPGTGYEHGQSIEFPWPTAVRDGDPMTLLASVDNEGTAPTDTTRIRTYLDDVQIDERVLTSGSGWGSFVLFLEWNATFGDHTFRVVADPLNETQEKDEQNNAFVFTVDVLAADAPVPDLVVTDVQAPDRLAPGDWTEITATIQNDGNATAEAFDTMLHVHGLGQTKVRFPGLDPGETVSLTLTGELAAEGPYWRGETYYAVVVDPFVQEDDAGFRLGGEVPEDNETNNYWSGTIGLRLPDLVVSDVRFGEGGVIGSDTLIEVDVTNSGEAGTLDGFFVAVSGHFWGSVPVPGTLSPGETHTLVLPGTVSRDVWVYARVDTGHDIAEMDEANSFTFEHTYPVDLAVTRFVAHDERPWSGEEVVFDVTVENLGDARIDAFTITFYADGVSREEIWVEGIGDDEATHFRFDWTALTDEPPGNTWGEHDFAVVLDPWFCCGQDDDPQNDRAETSVYVKLTPLPPWL